MLSFCQQRISGIDLFCFRKSTIHMRHLFRSEHTKEKTDSIESVFSFGRSIGASHLAPQGKAAAELGSHSPLGDRQARLSGGERANFREAKFPCSTYSSNGSYSQPKLSNSV